MRWLLGLCRCEGWMLNLWGNSAAPGGTAATVLTVQGRVAGCDLQFNCWQLNGACSLCSARGHGCLPDQGPEDGALHVYIQARTCACRLSAQT